jgi:hypothetical protein
MDQIGSLYIHRKSNSHNIQLLMIKSFVGMMIKMGISQKLAPTSKEEVGARISV